VREVLSVEAQDAVLEAIPEAERGIFLALARMGLRPSEAVALDAADYRDGWLMVGKARKGWKLSSPIRGTKSGAVKRLPVPEPLEAWIEAHLGPDARFQRRPLFANPRTGQRWTPTALRGVWVRALDAAGAPPIGLYEGTKHSFATDALLRGVPERALQAYLGHADVRSTRRYARLSDQALIDVIRRPGGCTEAAEAAGEKSPRATSRKHSASRRRVEHETGFEPATTALATRCSTN
jgi:integrase